MGIESANPTTVIALIAFIASGVFGLFTALLAFLKYVIDKLSGKLDKHTDALTGLVASIGQLIVKVDLIVDDLLDGKNNTPPSPPALTVLGSTGN
jgi:hypothetical protein